MSQYHSIQSNLLSVIALAIMPGALQGSPPAFAVDSVTFRAAPSTVTASPPPCDFKAQTCTVAECETLVFDISITGFPVPICLFVDPRTLPSGASFQAVDDVNNVTGTFEWTPHECQADTFVVHFLASFFGCFDFFNPSLFAITITVNDAKECPVRGACCKPDGLCEDLTEEACAACDGAFDGDSSCEVTAGEFGFFCLPGFGACCKSDGTCVDDTIKDTCELREQGEFMGAGTHCNPIEGPPLTCTGACCKNDFTCADGATKADCQGDPTSGEFRGAGTVCNAILPCSGACCFEDGACSHRPHKRDCEGRLGVFKGRDTECADQGGTVTCPFTGGACCTNGTPACVETGKRRCQLNGDSFVADGQTCPSPTKCPPSAGACCVPRGSSGFVDCHEPFTRQQCEDAGGPGNEYLGDGSRCGDDDNDGVGNCCDLCPNTPPGEPVVPCFPIQLAPFGCSCTQRGQLCDDGDNCTRDVCAPLDPAADPFGCLHRRDSSCCETDADCNDNDACTLDVCVSRACTNSRFTCENDGIPCTIDRCHPKLGCNYPNHSLCVDDNPCTDDLCVPEQGCTNSQKVCNDNIPCTRDRCDPIVAQGCVYTPDDTLCNDNNSCTDDMCDYVNPARDANGCIYVPRQASGLLDCGEGDVNGDGVTDLNDLEGITTCLNQSGPFVVVDSECPPADYDGDGDIDLADWQFAMNDPFRCEALSCETGIGGKCVTTCEVDELCLPQGGIASDPVTVASGASDCKKPCESELDCDFAVTKCQACRASKPGGQTVCQSFCEADQCQECDGVGMCRSRCRPERCEVCRDGRCEISCPKGQVCIQLRSGYPGPGGCFDECNGTSDCPPCHVCSFNSSPRGCVPCDRYGAVCADGKCKQPCTDASQCAACQRCKNGACLDDCPEGQACDLTDEVCRTSCNDGQRCTEPCKVCNNPVFHDAYCVECEMGSPCNRCNEDGACVSNCDYYSACEDCIGGICQSRCDLETQVCDGDGHCVPQ